MLEKFSTYSWGLEKYRLRFDGEFFRHWKAAFPDGEQPKTNAPGLDSPLKIDCLLKVSECTTLWDICKEVVSGSADNIFALNAAAQEWRHLQLNQDDWIYFEITDGSSKIPRKLFQFERVMEFREALVVDSCPKVCVLILDGSIERVREVVQRNNLSIWPERIRRPHIFTVPTFVIYKPYQNVYKMLKSLKSDLESVKSGLELSMMTLDELVEECTRKGIQVETAANKTRAELFRLLMHQ